MCKKFACPALFVWVLSLSSVGHPGVYDTRILGRGDANSDGVVNMADVATINAWLYSGGPAPPCLNQADADDSGNVDLGDSIYLLNWLYRGGSAPPAPGPNNPYCTTDPLPSPGCEVSICS